MKKWMILFMAVCAFAACKKEIILESIAVTTQPNKKEYFVNEAFDPAGMVVTATYSDKSTKPVTVTENMLEYDFSAVGTNKTVTITFVEKGKKASLPKLIFKPQYKFFHVYFIKLGFLDGWNGFLISCLSALDVFLRLCKIRMYQK